MQSVTKHYLIGIIERKMNATIHLHRKQNPKLLNMALYSKATAAELNDFICSIPYFDKPLKNFLLADDEQQTIISQAWELEFVKKCELWLGSYEWMYGKPDCSGTPSGKDSTKNYFLSLPF